MVNRVFIYGEFRYGISALIPALLGQRGDVATEAIEILREFSPSELIGRVYVLTPGGNYLPVSPYGVTNYDWYKAYQDAARESRKIRFKAKAGDSWDVLWIRQESDDSGPYIAVALKHE
jgi:hypothetical protein